MTDNIDSFLNINVVIWPPTTANKICGHIQWELWRVSCHPVGIIKWSLVLSSNYCIQKSPIFSTNYTNLTNIAYMFKQWWSTIPPISTKWTTTLFLKLLNTRKDHDNDIENPCPCLVPPLPRKGTPYPPPWDVLGSSMGCSLACITSMLANMGHNVAHDTFRGGGRNV